jgi:uncharacterized membrane protein YfcA
MVDPLGAVCMGGASAVGARTGAQLGQRFSEQQYRSAFGGVLLAISPLLAWSSTFQKEEATNPAEAIGTGSNGREEGLLSGCSDAWRMVNLYDDACKRPFAVVQFLGVGAVAGLLSGGMGLGATPVMISCMALSTSLRKPRGEERGGDGVCNGDGEGEGEGDYYKTCIGTALCAVVPSVIAGSVTHAQLGTTQWRALPVLAVGAAVGGACGSSIAVALPSDLLQQAFAVFCAAYGGMTLRGVFRMR